MIQIFWSTYFYVIIKISQRYLVTKKKYNGDKQCPQEHPHADIANSSFWSVP